MSEAGAFADAQTPGKEFSFVCKAIACCLEPHNARLGPEIVADWIDEDDLVDVIQKLGKFLSPEEDTEEKKPGATDKRGSKSNVD